jgi:hypothetical protein
LTPDAQWSFEVYRTCTSSSVSAVSLTFTLSPWPWTSSFWVVLSGRVLYMADSLCCGHAVCVRSGSCLSIIGGGGRCVCRPRDTDAMGS